MKSNLVSQQIHLSYARTSMISVLVLTALFVIQNDNYSTIDSQDYFYSPTKVLAKGANSTMNTYESANLGIRIEYPVEWNQVPDPVSNGMRFIPPNSTLAYVGVYAEELLDPKTTLEELTKSRLYTLENEFKASSISTLESEPAQLGTVGPGYEAIFQLENPLVKLKEMQSWAIKDGKEYLIIYDAQLNDFDKYLPMVQGMVDSLQVLSSVGPNYNKSTMEGHNTFIITTQNSTHGIGINYPVDWIKLPIPVENNNTILELEAEVLRQFEGEVVPNVEVEVFDKQENFTTFEEYSFVDLERIENTLLELGNTSTVSSTGDLLKIVEQGPVTIPGIESAYRAKFTITSPSEILNETGRDTRDTLTTIYFLNDDKIFEIDGYTPYSYIQYLPIVEGILNSLGSFRINR